jgi:glycosyltransferase involved in cell wall biosynthesis
VPYLIRPLGTLAPWSLRQKAIRKKVLLALSGMNALRGAAAVHYTSQQERQSVEAALGLEGGVVVPLGIDPNIFEELPASADKPGGFYVLAMSRLHPKKNLEALITAFVGCTAADTNLARWQLVIAGTGEAAYVRTLQQLIEESQARDRVRFVGWMDGEAKRDLVRHASLFALCSKHENFGLAVLEALAAGVPVLVSRQVDLAEDVDDARAGWVVDDVARTLREALANAIGNVAEREARGRAARDLAGRFAWPAVAGQMRRVYEGIRQHGAMHRAMPMMVPNP